MKHKSSEASRILRRAKKYDDALQKDFEKKLDTLLPVSMIALSRNMGWGKDRLMGLLRCYEREWETIAESNAVSALAYCEKITGIELRNEKGISYHELIYLNDAPLKPLDIDRYVMMRIRQKEWVETAMMGVMFVALHIREGWGYERLMRFMEWYYHLRDDELVGKDLLSICEEETGISMRRGKWRGDTD